MGWTRELDLQPSIGTKHFAKEFKVEIFLSQLFD